MEIPAKFRSHLDILLDDQYSISGVVENKVKVGYRGIVRPLVRYTYVRHGRQQHSILLIFVFALTTGNSCVENVGFKWAVFSIFLLIG